MRSPPSFCGDSKLEVTPPFGLGQSCALVDFTIEEHEVTMQTFEIVAEHEGLPPWER